MLKNLEEKPLQSLRKHPKSSLFVVLLLIPALVLSYNFFSSADDELEWSCPSCPGILGRITATPAPSPSPSPSAGPTAISHLAFAIGGSSATWHRRRVYPRLWWDPSSTRGHVWLDRRPDNLSGGAAAAACPPVRISPDSYSRFGRRSSASRIAGLVAESYKLGMEDVRWFVMGDDDTVFFPENLVGVLSKYDHNEMYYVGAPSESVEQDEMHSFGMAFGGGGFAVSAPAARELARVMGGCLERYRWFVMSFLSSVMVTSAFASSLKKRLSSVFFGDLPRLKEFDRDELMKLDVLEQAMDTGIEVRQAQHCFKALKKAIEIRKICGGR